MKDTYCKVAPRSANKTNETRDRLRTRLNQRKEEVNESLNKGCALDTKLCSKSNCSNCTTATPEIAIINWKSVNVSCTNTKAHANPVTSDAENRVSEVVHPVPPPANTKPTIISVETKKSTNMTNGQVPFPNVQIVPVGRLSQVCSAEQNINECQTARSASLNSDNADSRDINELLNYIEGNKTNKTALAQKKAAKKAIQRIKKAQKRERAEIEKQLKEEARIREKRKKEEERFKAEVLAKQLTEKPKKNWKSQKLQPKQKAKNSKKKDKSGSESSSAKKLEKKLNLIEETIPAMATIKRVADGSNPPATITITLKGATPESDKLLFTLVNRHNDKEHVTVTINTEPNRAKTDSKIKIQPQNVASKTYNDKKPKKKKKKITIALNKNSVANKKDASGNKKNTKSSNNSSSKVPQPRSIKNMKEASEISQSKPSASKYDINLPMLRLPPRSTITKIENPSSNRNCKASSEKNQSSNVPVSKTGVMVVETEKLIQQSIAVNNNKRSKKKNRKKRAQKAEIPETDGVFTDKIESSMVTLKNPVYYTLQTTLYNKVAEDSDTPMFQNKQKASIFKNKNGMITLRSPRLQNPFGNGLSSPSSYVSMCQNNFSKSSKKSSFSVQEILSGFSDIEITKVDKNAKGQYENKKISQSAKASIIPTNHRGRSADKFHIDKDDWPFESVFIPQDVLDEDMDPEERELEAFKRFCQQSVPPEHRVKVAHLNVQDIIFNMKKDVT